MIFELLVLQKLPVSSTWKYLCLHVVKMLKSQSDGCVLWYLCTNPI